MKGVTIIVILSIVWSVIAGIIEKKKAAAKKAAASSPKQPTVQAGQAEWKADPIKVKIESLRRRKIAQSVITIDPEPKQPRKVKPIKPLHVPDCPLPPQPSTRKSSAPAKQLAAMLHDKRNIRTAIVLNEILSKPVSQRN